MSIRSLLRQADTLGVTKLVWRDRAGWWECRADQGKSFTLSTIGKTGAEALGHVVSYLRSFR